MNYDLRYDGPDVEAELSSRQQGALMGTSMIVDALTSARQSRITADGARAAQLQAATLHADRAVWADTPGGVELAGLPDTGIARRWVACAAHPGKPRPAPARRRREVATTGAVSRAGRSVPSGVPRATPRSRPVR